MSDLIATAAAALCTGSVAGYAAPDMLVQLARLVMGNRDRDKMQLLPSCQELVQVGLGEEVHSLARLLGYIIRLKFTCGQPTGAQHPVLQRVDMEQEQPVSADQSPDLCEYRTGHTVRKHVGGDV